MSDAMVIDGSFGEGGGQILRTSLGLALVTGRAVRIHSIRARRQKPGLQRQHLTALRAAARVSGGEIEGDRVGSSSLWFRPGPVVPGDYAFDIGSAGSATLVLQTLLPALLVADRPSRITVEGGTHNPLAPPVDFLARAFLPLVARMGPHVTATLERPGFYPAGGGIARFVVEPAPLVPLDLVERGAIVSRRARAIVSRLPRSIAERELATVAAELGWDARSLAIEEVSDARGPGNYVAIEIAGEHATEVFSGFGERGVRAEEVARGACGEAAEWLAAGVPVGRHLADQLLIPLALAGGGRFRTLSPTEHTTTQAEMVRRFLGCKIALAPVDEIVWEVRVGA